MRKNIFLYLFVFAALIALFLLMKGNKTAKTSTEKIEALENEIATLKDSTEKLQFRLMDMQYFSLENNDDALAYYDHLNLENPTRYIEDKLLETNEAKGDNPLVPYAGMESDFKINKIKVLNHKWLLADFSDGKYWGDLVIKYELKDNLSVDFTLMDHLLYTRSNN
ncbi:hydrolase [Muricauda sp. SCSIO 64092]|uniref:hydrolase n=1 Tax=Allomuricauda sp. SCSIO 64092 TaxID=2908842 RepID=UPI001FF67715|nr:hydrolase [Muricauda sp. SCSIO 64092]UOY06305.1 hydrolase [Muricauda sp. SCSIO 64092]